MSKPETATHFFMIKYIATDLDGTLFYPKDKKNLIAKENLFFLQSFIDNGGKVILASGRSIEYGKRVEKAIGRECILIGYNGAVLYENNEILKSNNIDKTEVQEIIDDVTKIYKIPAVLIMTENGFFIKVRKGRDFFKKIYNVYNQFLGNYKEVYHKSNEEFEDALENQKIYKLMFFVGITRRKKRQAMELNKMIRNAFPNVESSWCNEVIEITPKDCSKGARIRDYCKIRNINDDEILVVGDSGNDISMFKEFKETSFCMAKAPEVIRKYAKFTISKYEDLSRYIIKK